MRAAFTKALVEIAEADPRVMLLTGDLGYTVLEPFAERFPARFFNVGVAEQNMVGVATGLAESGFVPFVYSIATFASLRPYEFIRNGPVHHRLPVRVVGVGGGFEYGPAGPSHYALEDIGAMRLQPGLTVIAPADHEQARSAVLETWDAPGPAYYRLGKDDRSVVPGLGGRFETGRVQKVREGTDLVWVAMGGIALEVAAAAETLSKRGVSSAVLVLASVVPPPVEDLAAELSRFPLAITVEAHSTSGGAGSLVSEVVAERGLGCRVLRCGIDRPASGPFGGQNYMQREHRLDSASLVARAVEALGLPLP